MQPILTILQKEIATFFNSLIAYVVLIVFLIAMGLFFWVFEYNILEPGNTYATMDALFFYGPYLFLFLIPAITMRAFSDEMKAGTLELLLTKPITEWQLVLGKYFAAIILIIIALIPTLVYYATVYWLGDPVGNLDHGATVGAYLGLVFLGGIFAAIGIFTSTLSDNQIVAFLFAVFLCFFMYQGLEFLAGFRAESFLNDIILHAGIAEHYRSISRGVIDSRDILYFISVIVIMLLLTRRWLEKRKG